jgi:hypothetical protein
MSSCALAGLVGVGQIDAARAVVEPGRRQLPIARGAVESSVAGA